MQAIVLAAGEGSRMRPLTASRPKVMLPVGGEPLLLEILLRARATGVNRFVLVVGYRADLIRDYFADGSRWDLKIEYAYQEEQLGTGHALLSAESLAEDRFLLLNGDVLTDEVDLGHLVGEGEPIVTTKHVPDPERYGVILTAEDGRLQSILEKSPHPPSDLANAGIYLLERDIFDALRQCRLSERGEYELTDALNLLAQRGRSIRIQEISQWLEVGRPWDLLEANAEVLTKRPSCVLGEVEPGATLIGKVQVQEGALVRSGSYIQGPVYVGESCRIGPNCYLRPGTCLERDVHIGHAVEIKNSIVMKGTNIGHLSYLGDSVVGSGCNFGAGTIVANLRNDGKSIRSYIKGQAVDSGRRKLGVVMGDGVKTGIHTSIYPGTVIEPGFRSRPAEVLRGHVVVE